MVDTTGDGQFDSVMVDSTGDGVANATIKIQIAYDQPQNGAALSLEVRSLAATHLQVVVQAGKMLKLDELVDAITTYAETQLGIQVHAVDAVGGSNGREIDFCPESVTIGTLTIPKPRGNDNALQDPPWEVPSYANLVSLCANANNRVTVAGQLRVLVAPPAMVQCCTIL